MANWVVICPERSDKNTLAFDIWSLICHGTVVYVLLIYFFGFTDNRRFRDRENKYRDRDSNNWRNIKSSAALNFRTKALQTQAFSRRPEQFTTVRPSGFTQVSFKTTRVRNGFFLTEKPLGPASRWLFFVITLKIDRWHKIKVYRLLWKEKSLKQASFSCSYSWGSGILCQSSTTLIVATQGPVNWDVVYPKICCKITLPLNDGSINRSEMFSKFPFFTLS